MEAGQLWCANGATICTVPEGMRGLSAHAIRLSALHHPERDLIQVFNGLSIRERDGQSGSFVIDNDLHAKQLCIGDLCVGRAQLSALMNKTGVFGVEQPPLLDEHTRPEEFPMTYREAQKLCETKGQRLCRRQDLCRTDGTPTFALPPDMQQQPHWVAVSDDVNEWITFDKKQPCRTWRELHRITPSWGHSKSKQGFHRGVKCCAT